ncbi:MAG: hypothetical protein FD173_621 [Gallionellaceae bacterium]|nr:MAG: hypothetical protein FD173_621 [Gallionellaceae bacterium]
MKGNIIKKSYLSILTILMFTGCAKQGSAPFVSGELVHDRGDGNLLVLKAPNRQYEARGFIIERYTHMAELRKRYYGINPKHWERIFSGLDTDHVTYSIETVAKSADGQEISCRVMWGGAVKPAGVCTDQAETAFQVRFE